MIAHQKAARSVRDISHLFLSCGGPPEVSPPPLFAVLPESGAAAQKACGRIIVDRDRIVRQINPVARQLLNLPPEEPVGQVFDLYIAPDTIQHISIQRHNGQPGIGRMVVSGYDTATGSLLCISIQDITAP